MNNNEATCAHGHVGYCGNCVHEASPKCDHGVAGYCGLCSYAKVCDRCRQPMHCRPANCLSFAHSDAYSDFLRMQMRTATK